MNKVKSSRGISFLTRVGIACLGLIIGLLLLEVVCRLLYPFPQNFYRESPLCSLEFAPNDEGWYSMPLDGLRHWVRINSKGLRDVEHSYEKQNGVFRILVLGDPFAAALEMP